VGRAAGNPADALSASQILHETSWSSDTVCCFGRDAVVNSRYVFLLARAYTCLLSSLARSKPAAPMRVGWRHPREWSSDHWQPTGAVKCNIDSLRPTCTGQHPQNHSLMDGGRAGAPVHRAWLALPACISVCPWVRYVSGLCSGTS